MCNRPGASHDNDKKDDKTKSLNCENDNDHNNNDNDNEKVMALASRRRRGKRDKVALVEITQTRRISSKAFQRHGHDAPSGGIQSLLPSFIGVAVLVCAVAAKLGFRGRATVAGIDLGTTNSVICVQAPAKGVGEIECIPDPSTGSPIVPSVVSFLEASERKVGPSSKVPSFITPHPSHVVVGQTAKRRIDSHPHHTLYNAKRVLGRLPDDPAIQELRTEVEFRITDDEEQQEIAFVVPDSPTPVPPWQVGSYVVHHLMQITKEYLGHDNVKSAVICVPAKFDHNQKMRTYQAFKNAGINVARVVEEPTAAALAYGLHRKQGVDYILVYDFGGGTLDISLLHVSDGFVDVMGSDGDDRLGGTDFDTAVARFLLEERGGNAVVSRAIDTLKQMEEVLDTSSGIDLEEQLSAACPLLAETPLCTPSSYHTLGEQLKIALSAFPHEKAEVEETCMAPPERYSSPPTLQEFCSTLVPVKLKITSAEYEKSVQPLFSRSIVPVERLLRDLDLSTNDIDEVVMVGGTTRMPQIRELVRKVLPTSQLNTHIDPDITVAYGAASVID